MYLLVVVCCRYNIRLLEGIQNHFRPSSVDPFPEKVKGDHSVVILPYLINTSHNLTDYIRL